MKLVALYLDEDVDRNDLLDEAGNPIPAGWYLYQWPLGEPIAGPFGDLAELRAAPRLKS